MEPTTKAARDILAMLEATFQSTHRYVAADPAHYRYLDIGWYNKTARLLEANGFRTIRDVEDRTITESPGTVLSAIMVRTMLSRDGVVVSALYHPHVKSFWLRLVLWLLRKLPGKVTDMETEFSDGSFVSTTNAASAAAIENGPMIQSEFLAAETPTLEVLERHQVRVAEHLRERPGITARVVNNFDDMLAAQHRMNALKAAYRGEIGMITREELDSLATLGGRRLVPEVHAEIVRKRARRAG